ncbi:hypothetical protein Tco_1508523 [Tanacetum coccineum]
MDHTSSMEEAQRGVGFALDPLTKLAQHVTSKNDMLAILRFSLKKPALLVCTCAKCTSTNKKLVLSLLA